MAKILVSSCLLGCKVRYNGSCMRVEDAHFKQLLEPHEIIPFCPEVSAGLPIPRVPAEIKSGEGTHVLQGKAKVVGIDGTDFTDYFYRGAQMALDKCLAEKISLAILTEASPSCGSALIYDGSHKGNKIAGAGVTAALLRENGITVCSQHDADRLLNEI